MNIDGLTDEEKRVRIAQACPTVATLNEEGEWVWKHYQVMRRFLPLSDLNAMHEAEKLMPARQLDLFDRYLMAHTGAFQTAAIHATARQRADAFLLTLP